MSDYLGRYYNLTGGWTEQRGYWWPMLAEIMTTGADVQAAADNFCAAGQRKHWLRARSTHFELRTPVPAPC